jgi:hypothetical protein
MCETLVGMHAVKVDAPFAQRTKWSSTDTKHFVMSIDHKTQAMNRMTPRQAKSLEPHVACWSICSGTEGMAIEKG